MANSVAKIVFLDNIVGLLKGNKLVCQSMEETTKDMNKSWTIQQEKKTNGWLQQIAKQIVANLRFILIVLAAMRMRKARPCTIFLFLSGVEE
jgi:hypothetical protein